MSDPFRLDGRRVVVTGGAGLLGREFAAAVVAQGGEAVLLDRDADALQSAVATVGTRASARVGDITDEAWVVATIAALATEGPIEGLVNSAALDPKMAAPGPERRPGFTDTSLADFRASLDVDLAGTMLVSREVVRAMLLQGERGRGSIVNVSSIYGLAGPDQRLYDLPDRTPGHKPLSYPTTKAGVVGFTRALAASCAGTGIRVNALVPGGVRGRPDPVFEEAYGQRTMVGRMAEPHELGGPLVFLLSDAASYVTGSQLVVDGGWTAW